MVNVHSKYRLGMQQTMSCMYKASTLNQIAQQKDLTKQAYEHFDYYILTGLGNHVRTEENGVFPKIQAKMKFPKDALSFMNDTHRELEQGESQVANGLKAL